MFLIIFTYELIMNWQKKIDRKVRLPQFITRFPALANLSEKCLRGVACKNLAVPKKSCFFTQYEYHFVDLYFYRYRDEFKYVSYIDILPSQCTINGHNDQLGQKLPNMAKHQFLSTLYYLNWFL